VYRRGQGGVAVRPARPGFAPPSGRLAGNNDPPWTGSPGNGRDMPGPHPASQPMGGSVGHYDGYSGTDPSRPLLSPAPSSVVAGAWSEGDPGSRSGPCGPPLGYGEGAGRLTDPGASGNAGRLNAPNLEEVTPALRPSWWRQGILGFNDQLQVRDRHVYWDRGSQNSGIDGVPHGLPNTYNPDLRHNRARPDLRSVNISVNPQIGSDATRSQDDLTRPYTWLGQQDGTRQPVYGGVPGLHASYGNRGFSNQIHDPSNGQGGPVMVSSGPPHGLHSDTLPDGKQIADRYKANPQMRPVRQDRPANSAIAGQSYSQLVVPQAQTGAAATGAASHNRAGFGLSFGTRGWAGS